MLDQARPRTAAGTAAKSAAQEITKLVQLVSEIAGRMGVDHASAPDVQEMKREVAPEAVLDAIEENAP